MTHLFKGFRLANSNLKLLIPLYLVNLIAAAILASFPSTRLLATSTNTVIEDIADGVDTWYLMEVVQNASINDMLNLPVSEEPMAQIGFTLLPALIGIPILALLTSAFLRGGVLLALSEGFQSWKRFWWGCRRWFVSFMLLGFLHFLVFGVVAFATSVGATAIGAVFASGVWATIGLGLLVWLVWFVVSEMGGTAVILSNRRNILWGISQGMRQLFRHPLQTLGFYLPILLLIATVHALFRLYINPSIPLTWWHLLLLVSQLFVLIRLWLRLTRFGGVVSLLSEQLLAQKPEDDVYADGEQDGDNDRGSDWGIKSEVAPLDGDITRQTT